MRYSVLGDTGINVSKLCYGTLTIGPLQAKLPVDIGAELLSYAFDKGVNFLDTAELYELYPYINKAIKGRRNNIVISTKAYVYDKKGAEKSLRKALKELNTDYIDIFSLHEQESEHTLRGHEEALEYFVRAKEKGYIRAVGISTHAIAAVKGSMKYKDIEVIHAIINKNGLGILDGTRDEMLQALEIASTAGKGIYAMKALGGGNLLHDVEDSLNYVFSLPCCSSIAIGMQSHDEIDANIYFEENKKMPEHLIDKIQSKKRKLLIDYWCIGCGNCIKKCQQGALSLIDGKAVVDPSKCVLCGYCGASCKEFCIKIF